MTDQVIRRCKLIDIDPEDCDYDAPLFYNEDDENSEGGFELDSVDALELVAGVKEDFGIVINAEEANVFYSINTLSDYILDKMK